MRAKTRIIVIVLFFVLPFLSFAESGKDKPTPNTLFVKANSLYSVNDYDGAISAYEQIISRGFEGGNVYYNLANAYFKKGDLGKAVLNYERARRIMPRDADLRTNYNFALSQVKQNFSAMAKPYFLRAIHIYSNALTINEMAIIFLILFISLIIVFIISLYIKSFKRYIFFIAPVIIILITINIISLFLQARLLGKKAVIIAESVESRFEPLGSATPHFRLFEGTAVLIIEKRGSWYKVERPDNRIGWVEGSALEII